MWLMMICWLGVWSVPVSVGVPDDGVQGAVSENGLPVLMRVLGDELRYCMNHLVYEDGSKPYYLAYEVYDEQTVVLAGSLGALVSDSQDRHRYLNIDLRVGDYKLDSTHQIRGGGSGRAFGGGNIRLPLGDEDRAAIRHILWLHTDRAFKNAAQRYVQVQTNLKVKVEETDQSDDFSREKPEVCYESPAALSLDTERWRGVLRRVSALAKAYPKVYQSGVTLGTYAGTRYLVTSEGTRLRTSQRRYRVTLQAVSKADDGMDLMQSADFNASSPDGLPDEAALVEAFRLVLDQVNALRDAPLAEPYTGPAILLNRASGVFFHEIFGHRIEGHRQRDVTEGQTFTKKIGTEVLPTFLTVVDDPTRRRLAGVDLRGYYTYDDEGVKASKVTLVDHGVLKTFLMSREPVAGFPQSNGHGRRQPGSAIVSRQANLIVESDNQVPFARLREMLVEECGKQGKPYGLLFEDISGGFTTTRRSGPQSFKVLPIVVYRVYADGRPDKLLRGVDIVGTPLSCFERIVCTADDTAVFNGTCGAESGWVPVSAASPSVLLSQIEIEKREVNQSRPPILPPPPDDPPGKVTARRADGDVDAEAGAEAVGGEM